MGEAEKAKASKPKKNWFKGLATEFNKIIWPDKVSVAKQTVVVTVVTVIVGALIKVIDMLVQLGLDLLF